MEVQLAPPVFKLQIVHAESGIVATFAGGSPFEADLVRLIAGAVADAVRERFAEAVVQETRARGVGFFRTEAHVVKDLRDGLAAALAGDVQVNLVAAVKRAVQAFKDETRRAR